MERIDKQLLELVKAAIWKDYQMDTALFSECNWDGIFNQAKVQTLVAIVEAGLGRLYQQKPSCVPNRQLLFKWAAQSSSIADGYSQHLSVIRKTHELLENEKITHVFMKGVTCGVRYPEPERRQCGDIDFVVHAADFQRTLDALEKIGKVDRTLVHEHHGMAYVDGVTLEPHYKIHNYQNPHNDATMQHMFDCLNDQFVVLPENTDVSGIPVFPPEFEGMFLVSHMVNHVYEEGLGLRQVLDFVLFLQKECYEKKDCFDREAYDSYLSQMNMLRAHRIFTRIGEQYLGLSTAIFNYEYSASEIRFADQMMKDILRVGNFGRGEYQFKRNGFTGEIQNYCWVTGRALKYRYLCPTEAWSWPVSKFLRFWAKKVTPNRYGKNKG